MPATLEVKGLGGVAGILTLELALLPLEVPLVWPSQLFHADSTAPRRQW